MRKALQRGVDTAQWRIGRQCRIGTDNRIMGIGYGGAQCVRRDRRCIRTRTQRGQHQILRLFKLVERGLLIRWNEGAGGNNTRYFGQFRQFRAQATRALQVRNKDIDVERIGNRIVRHAAQGAHGFGIGVLRMRIEAIKPAMPSNIKTPSTIRR